MCGHDLEYLLIDLESGEQWGPYITIAEARAQVERVEVGKWEIVSVDGDGAVSVVI